MNHKLTSGGHPCYSGHDFDGGVETTSEDHSDLNCRNSQTDPCQSLVFPLRVGISTAGDGQGSIVSDNCSCDCQEGVLRTLPVENLANKDFAMSQSTIIPQSSPPAKSADPISLSSELTEKYAKVDQLFHQVVSKLRDLRKRALLDMEQFTACFIAFSAEFGSAPTVDHQIEICQRWMPAEEGAQ